MNQFKDIVERLHKCETNLIAKDKDIAHLYLKCMVTEIKDSQKNEDEMKMLKDSNTELLEKINELEKVNKSFENQHNLSLVKVIQELRERFYDIEQLKLAMEEFKVDSQKKDEEIKMLKASNAELFRKIDLLEKNSEVNRKETANIKVVDEHILKQATDDGNSIELEQKSDDIEEIEDVKSLDCEWEENDSTSSLHLEQKGQILPVEENGFYDEKGVWYPDMDAAVLAYTNAMKTFEDYGDFRTYKMKMIHDNQRY